MHMEDLKPNKNTEPAAPSMMPPVGSFPASLPMPLGAVGMAASGNPLAGGGIYPASDASAPMAMVFPTAMPAMLPMMAPMGISNLSRISGIEEEKLLADPNLLALTQHVTMQHMAAAVAMVGATPAMGIPGSAGLAIGGPTTTTAGGAQVGGFAPITSPPVEATGKGKKGKASKKKKSVAALEELDLPSMKLDPGGKVIWAKVGNSPWWPGKTLSEDTDLSFPPPDSQDRVLARPGSQPVRFFGTYEVAWVGSKRQMVDWERGLKQGYLDEKSGGEVFATAVREVETYRTTKELPEVFYRIPEREGVRRSKTGPQLKKNRPVASVGGKGGAGSKRGSEMTDEARWAAVQERKRRCLLKLGLLPPADSPFATGKIAPNAAVIRAGQAWEVDSPAVMEDARERVERGEFSKPPRARVPRQMPQYHEAQHHQYHDADGGDEQEDAMGVLDMRMPGMRGSLPVM